MAKSNVNIKELAESWLEYDEDEKTREEISQLLKDGNNDELERRLHPRISFGTAGLRGPMKAGFACMNSLTVIQASQGLALYLLDQVEDVKTRGVVVGRDARHNSKEFAKLTAATLIAHGIKVWWYESINHTPMVPFGVCHFGAAAGIMITASHNPAQDNGYKVYWGNGCQTISPHDVGIADAIIKGPKPSAAMWDLSVVDDVSNSLIEYSLEKLRGHYFDAVKASISTPPSFDPNFRFVYTPMHGVGLGPMTHCADVLGIKSRMTVVEEQAHPHPDFPTVKFPNPEEKGALDLAIKTADASSIPLIVASDPDADRLAAAEKVAGKWQLFTGNQLGILLGAYFLEMYPKEKDRGKLAMLASTVSSQMLPALAKKEGFHFQETLTGFKWLGNIALDLEAQNYDVVYAFEEALGYMVTSVAHDKDSIGAAAHFLTAVAQWAKQGLTPYTKLQQLYQHVGYFEDANTYLISPSPDTTTTVFGDIRKLDPDSPHPTQIGNNKILRWRDLTMGHDSKSPDNKPDLPIDPSSQMITCELEGGARFTVRGSGTEPKIKLYIECVAESSEEAKRGAQGILQDLLHEWFVPEKYGLRLA